MLTIRPMKTSQSWAIRIAGSALLVACMACKGGGGGGSRGLAPGATAGSSGERGRVTFQLPSEQELGMVRLYVGKQTRSYDTTFELTGVQNMNAVLTAIEPRLARLLGQPDVYFVALTFVDRRGRESGFSNEVRIDTRGRGTASVQSALHALWSGARERADRPA